MEYAELAGVIKGRRSIRQWQDKAVPEELLIKAVELATWAPSGGNRQNWFFYIIVNQDTLQDIADIVQTGANQITAWPEASILGNLDLIRDRASFFRHAPAAIAVATSRYQSPFDQIMAARAKIDAEARRIHRGYKATDSRIQSVSAAIAYLLLILHQMGLGAVWMLGPLHCKQEIERILRVPPKTDIVAFIPVGYPGETPASPGRRPVGEVCQVIR